MRLLEVEMMHLRHLNPDTAVQTGRIPQFVMERFGSACASTRPSASSGMFKRDSCGTVRAFPRASVWV